MLNYKTIFNSLWINTTAIQKYKKYKNIKFRIMIILKMKVKDQNKPRKCQKRKIYEVQVKAVNGLEQELANFSRKGLESIFRLCKPKR